jgi:hypothetical protein
MESVGILRALWRRPALLALGVLLAIGFGMLAMYRVSLSPIGLGSRATVSGYAFERALVDTPQSLVAASRPKGATSIFTRATLLGDLMAGDRARAAMARGLGLSPAAIGVLGPSTSTPATETPLATQALEVTRPHEPYVLNISEDTDQPILSLLATAPSQEGAARLSKAAIAALTAEANRASSPRGGLRVTQLGEAETGIKQTSPGKKKAAIAAIAILLIWCVAIVVIDGLRRRLASPAWRHGAEARG